MQIHNYNIVEQLGQGAFSIVFKGNNIVTGKEVAIKVSKDPGQRLKHESKILMYLNRERVACAPTLYWYGACGSNSCIATTLYKKPLEPVTALHKGLVLCGQIISGLQAIHMTGIVHSDIKPDNFMLDHTDKISIIDFGLSTLIYNRDKGIMRENEKSNHIIGSCKYASYNLHMGNSVSFRDDLISAGYVMMWIFGLHIPWSGIHVDCSMKPLYDIGHPENIERAKRKHLSNLTIDQPHLNAYFKRVYELKYEEIPKYGDYLLLFSTLQI